MTTALVFSFRFVILAIVSYLLVVLVAATAATNPNPNTNTNTKTTKIAFGSCHKNKRSKNPPIWSVIEQEEAKAWIWTGDAMYSSSRDPTTGKKRYGPVPPQELQSDFDELKTNATIGYQHFLASLSTSASSLTSTLPVYGTWDDHDYGGNDAGEEMPLRKERQQVFWDFLGYKPHSHDGVYHAVDIVDDNNNNNTIKIILLDTRWFRQAHCIPSVAQKIPLLGNAIACATRWMTAGFFLHRFAWLWGMDGCEDNSILGQDQWQWLEDTLESSTADLNVIVSSIQVFTTNPAMESWGHFPKEQKRLWNLLETHYSPSSTSTSTSRLASPVILLSGDAHHGEISGQPGYLEITSSGLTHHCGQPPLYGRLCQPILESFYQHRPAPNSFYIGLNYGVLTVDWEKRTFLVQVKNDSGKPVLQVEQSLDKQLPQLPAFKELPPTWNGHLIPIRDRIFLVLLLAGAIVRAILIQKKTGVPTRKLTGTKKKVL